MFLCFLWNGIYLKRRCFFDTRRCFECTLHRCDENTYAMKFVESMARFHASFNSDNNEELVATAMADEGPVDMDM